MIELICPNCGNKIIEQESSYLCDCGLNWRKESGIIVNPDALDLSETGFYDKIYNEEKGSKWLQGLNRSSWIKRVLEIISLSYRRERFFKKNIKGSNNLILDLGCGAGRDYLGKYGEVIGIDLSKEPLLRAKDIYSLVILSDIKKLPFADNTFDFVISSDLFGHIKSEDKDVIYREIERVLKPKGLTLNVIETDSNNVWFKFAHKFPELFQKYFILAIGGHFGLELPSDCINRFRTAGFEVIKSKKIWGTVWPIQDYLIFDNEYLGKSKLIDATVFVSKILSRNRAIKIVINIILNPVNSLVESITPMNNGQGLMLVCQKKNKK